MFLVVPLSLVAALLFAFSDFLEQRAARQASRSEAQPQAGDSRVARVAAGLVHLGGTLRRLVRDRVWFLGWALGTVATLVQAVALNFGSVAVVQSLQVTTLLFAIPLTAYGLRCWPSLRDWSGGILVVAGLAVLLLARGNAGGSHRRSGALLLILLALAGWVVVAVVLAQLRPAPVRPVLLALAAGTASGAGAALVKLTVSDLTGPGVLATAQDWPGYSLAVATGSALVLQQTAFAEGRLAGATAAMITTVPFVGYLISVIGFGEHLPTGETRLAGVAGGGLLLVLGISLLAHSPLLFGSEEEDEAAVARVVPGRPGWAES